jgi:hypothetical protein
VQPENRDWLVAEAARARRSVPEVLDLLIEHARAKGLDTSSGQARETVAAMADLRGRGGRGKRGAA